MEVFAAFVMILIVITIVAQVAMRKPAQVRDDLRQRQEPSAKDDVLLI